MTAIADNAPSPMDRWLYGVLRTGPYRGHLVVGREPFQRGGAVGAPNPVSVLSPSGEVVLLVPGSDTGDGRRSLDVWLKEKGWAI